MVGGWASGYGRKAGTDCTLCAVCLAEASARRLNPDGKDLPVGVVTAGACAGPLSMSDAVADGLRAAGAALTLLPVARVARLLEQHQPGS